MYSKVIMVIILHHDTTNQSNRIGDIIQKGRDQIFYYFSIE